MLYPKRKAQLSSLILLNGFFINNFCAFATTPKKTEFFNPLTHDSSPTLPITEKSQCTSPISKCLPSQQSSIYAAEKITDEATDQKIDNITSFIVKRLKCSEPEYIRDYTKKLLLHVYKNYEPSEEIILVAAIYWYRISNDFLFNILKRDEKSSYTYTLISLLCIADKFAGYDTYFPSAKDWSTLFGADLDKVIEYEKDLCIHFNFNLYVSAEEYQLYKTLLA